VRRAWPLLLFASTLAAVPGARADEATEEADLLKAKCTLCHTSMQIYVADRAKLKEVVDRMTAKNPEWFKDTDSRHLLAVLTRMLGDP